MGTRGMLDHQSSGMHMLRLITSSSVHVKVADVTWLHSFDLCWDVVFILCHMYRYVWTSLPRDNISETLSRSGMENCYACLNGFTRMSLKVSAVGSVAIHLLCFHHCSVDKWSDDGWSEGVRQMIQAYEIPAQTWHWNNVKAIKVMRWHWG